MLKSIISLSSFPSAPPPKKPLKKTQNKRVLKPRRKVNRKNRSKSPTLKEFLEFYHQQEKNNDYENLMKSKTEDWLEKYGLAPLTETQSTLTNTVMNGESIKIENEQNNGHNGNEGMDGLVWLLNPMIYGVWMNLLQGNSEGNPIMVD